jgi:ectoine hydroxylase-related dioxygenase (phytanoyl-CoA dioxygenase family)
LALHRLERLLENCDTCYKDINRDSAYFDCNNAVIAVWIPLQDTGETNACLKAIPGSQAWGSVQHIGLEVQLDLSEISLDKACSYPVRKGGICIMDKNNAHYSGKNESPGARRALIFRYEKIGANICPDPISPNSARDRLHSFFEKLSWVSNWLQTLDPAFQILFYQ